MLHVSFNTEPPCDWTREVLKGRNPVEDLNDIKPILMIGIQSLSSHAVSSTSSSLRDSL